MPLPRFDSLPVSWQQDERTMTDAHESGTSIRILIGLAIVLVGFAMLVQRNDGWGLHLDLRWWPFLLIILGLARMAVPGERGGRRRSRRGGFWLLAVGVWGVISEMQLFGFDYSTSWPLLVIAVGVNIVWRSMDPPSRWQIREQ